jgi:uncharacterized membrane protein YbhN (UPF0104 family)
LDTVTKIADRPKSWRRWLPRLLRVGIGIVVALGVGHRLWSERDRLGSVARQVEISWLLLSGVLYVAGLSTCALFWWRSICDQGVRPGLLTTWTAYFAGHLGKYVPGKGLVIVIRAGLLRDSNVSLATGAISCAYETLLMMATGALVSVVLFPVIPQGMGGSLMIGAIFMLAVLGVPALPPCVSLWSRLATRPFLKDSAGSAYRCRWTVFGWGVCWVAGGWFLMGLSLAAVLASLHSWGLLVARFGWPGAIGLVTAVSALATVGGFLSFLPGGLGSREWILVETLAPALGEDRTADAAVAAVLLRVVWIVAELVATAVFWQLDRQWNNRRGETP